MLRTLFDFSFGNLTCVEAETVNLPPLPKKTQTAEAPPVDNCVLSVYLASEEGYENYCASCLKLVAVQETDFRMFPLRIFCMLKKCEKP